MPETPDEMNNPPGGGSTAGVVPTDKGGGALNSKFWGQAEWRQHVTSEAAQIVVNYFGEFAEVKAYADTFRIDDAFPLAGAETYLLADIDLTRSAGPSGRLVLTYSDTAADTSLSVDAPARIRKVSWRLNSVPIDISVYKYCGSSQVNNANPARIKYWWNNAGDDPESSMADMLNEYDIKIAEKLLAGSEVVQRHYPVLAKVTQATRGRLKLTGELDHICQASDLDGAPAHLAGRAARWLKQQEDIETGADGSQTLTESWIGGDGFDLNFYGDAPDRWAFGSI